MKSTLPLIAALAMTVAMPAFAAENAVTRAPHGDGWQGKTHATTGPEGLAQQERRAHKGGEHKERFENATPEQREKMKAHHEERKKRWENATPEEREKMKQRKAQMHEKWKNAPPEERERMKKHHHEMKERFENASPEQREQMRLRHEEMRKKWQNASPEERESFKARRAIEHGGQPQFNTPALKPVSTEGGVTELPRRHQTR